MKISKIEPQKKNKKRCSIYINGEFRFGVTQDIVVQHDLKEGDEITEAEVNDILHEEEQEQIRTRALRLLQHRQRSVRELRDKLLRAGYNHEYVETVINDFIADKTLDDERFAHAFASDYTALKPKGNRFLVRELVRKGIAKETINEILGTRNEKELVVQFIQKKLHHIDMNDAKARHKAVSRLLYHGFTPGIVYDVMNEYARYHEEP